LKEISFSIPVNGVIRIDGNIVTIIVNRAVTTVTLDPIDDPPQRTVFEPGTSMFDIILESAQEFINRTGHNRFTGLNLYDIARETFPSLNKRSFMARMTAATPNHSSYKHHHSRRDYFQRIAPGIYSLEFKYLQDNPSSNEVEPSDSKIEFTGDNR